MVSLTLNVPIPDKKKKTTLIFIFTLLCGASKSFMKAFKAPQRSENQHKLLKCTGPEGLKSTFYF